MPTVLLLDVSLSMYRPIKDEVGLSVHQTSPEDNEDIILHKTLAVMGCTQILDHFSMHCKLEFTSLIIFSSLYEVVERFTRDFDAVKEALSKVDDYDKTNIQVGLVGASQHILEEWGNGTPCKVVLITDGNLGTGQMALTKTLFSSYSHGVSQFPLPFPFPASLNIVCITNPDDPSFKMSQGVYQKLVEMNGQGSLYVPEGNLSTKSVTAMFEKLINENFLPYNGVIQCGNLSTAITLSPPPQQATPIDLRAPQNVRAKVSTDENYNEDRRAQLITRIYAIPKGEYTKHYNRQHDFEIIKETVNDTIRICGFLNVADVSSPPAFSRHLVLPIVSKDDLTKLSRDAVNDDDGVGGDEGKVPSFCVLLHGGLKRENSVALCEVGQNWYGIFYSWADSKKKSNLMLSVFEPGTDVIPWLGRISSLGPAEMLTQNPYEDSSTPFPIKAHETKSYAQNCVVWVRQGGLHSDVQKILRHARKLPEKHASFYKELNRVRKAALMYGFPELLTGLANILERECYNLPTYTLPEASIHLQHAAEDLRAWDKKDPRQNIVHYKKLTNEY